MSIYV